MTRRATAFVIAAAAAAVVAYTVASYRNKGAERTEPAPAPVVSTPDTTRTEPDELRVGNAFPSVGLIAEPDTADNMARIATGDVIGAHSALILFLTQNCEPCDATVKAWSASLAGLPADVLVFGVINASPEARNGYRVQTDAMFPIYSDSQGAFASKYNVAVYPSLVGVDANGKIAFVENALDPSITPDAALIRLRSASNP